MVDVDLWQPVCPISELSETGIAKVTLEGRPIGLFLIDDQVYALDDICSHGNACLSDGLFEDGIVECPLHAGLFDVRTGKAVGAPAIRDALTYDVSLRDGQVFLKGRR